VVTNVALIYDPTNHTIETWGALMCELYAAQNLSMQLTEDNWREWGDGLKSLDVFTNEGAPSTNGFATWQDWASALMGAVNPAV